MRRGVHGKPYNQAMDAELQGSVFVGVVMGSRNDYAVMRGAVEVLGVPIPATSLQGLDSLLSIVQMPKGIPVGTLAIGSSGAVNAGLLAVAMLATTDAKLQEKLVAWRAARRDEVLAQTVGEDEVDA